MTYKNSVRILTSNFSLCWKQLVWQIISSLVIFGLGALAIIPVLNFFKAENFFVMTNDLFESLYTTPKQVPQMFVDVCKTFAHLIRDGARAYAGSYAGFVICILVGGNLFRCIGQFACSEVVGARMASNARVSYTSRLVSTLGRSISYSFVHLLVSLPFWAAFVGLGVAYVKLAKTTLLSIALLPVFSVVVYVVFALKISMFSCMLGEMTDGIRNPFVAFGRGLKVLKTRFWRTFSNSICVVLSIVFVNVFIGLFTICAGLVITIPASSVFLSIFGMVTSYAGKKRNFYVSELVVVNLK